MTNDKHSANGAGAAAHVAAALVAALAWGAAAGAEPADALFAPFDELLQAHVADGDVDYGAFDDADAFDAMIDRLGGAAPARKASRAERLAFYINAYNALSIKGILDGYSPASIWSRIRFFKRRKYDLADTEMSLYELEHERIIPEGDPRIHFAIVCASASCPPLRSRIYRPETLDAELDAVTRAFVNDRDNNAFDVTAKQATLSRIFDWYRDEFERDAGGLGAYLARYVDDEALAESLRSDDWDFDFRDYDWSLNGSPP
jgi:hypothetical protein